MQQYLYFIFFKTLWLSWASCAGRDVQLAVFCPGLQEPCGIAGFGFPVLTAAADPVGSGLSSEPKVCGWDPYVGSAAL